MAKKTIAIIGGGPASMMLACSLNSNKYEITIYEKNIALGRKFLVAGKGGFNLTHSENLQQFIERYTPSSFIKPFLGNFSNADFRDWLQTIGVDTYVGTSKRVFPIKGIKPIEVLKAIEKKLAENNVNIKYNHEWIGWKNENLLFNAVNGSFAIKSDVAVFALGGGSWNVTGSNSKWLDFFAARGIKTKAFYPSNCAYKVNWSSAILKTIEGQALKNCDFKCGAMKRKGEVVLTAFGIEGSGIYPLSPEIRAQLLNNNKDVKIQVDFKPELTEDEIKKRFLNKGKQSIKDFLEKRLNLSAVQITLIKSGTNKEEYNDIEALVKFIKHFPITISGTAPLDEAISTVGGIDLNEVGENLQLIKLPEHYCMGEMLDWDAPTGGYLLQACFSMGRYLANHLNKNA